MSERKQSYSHAKADARKERKRQEAYIRQAVWDALTIEQKLARMGKKELAKHEKRMKELEKNPNLANKPVSVKVNKTVKKQTKTVKKVANKSGKSGKNVGKSRKNNDNGIEVQETINPIV